MTRTTVPLRVIVERPPRGVRWALQRSRGNLDDLVPPVQVDAGRVVLEVEVLAQDVSGRARFSGPAVQGPTGGRFLYVSTGSYAGDGSDSGRRAKVGLEGLAWSTIEALAPGQHLEVRIAGTAPDGGAACATVPLLPPGWAVA